MRQIEKLPFKLETFSIGNCTTHMLCLLQTFVMNVLYLEWQLNSSYTWPLSFIDNTQVLF